MQNFSELTPEAIAAMHLQAQKATKLEQENRQLTARIAWLKQGGAPDNDESLAPFLVEAAQWDGNKVTGFDLDSHPGLTRHLNVTPADPSGTPTGDPAAALTAARVAQFGR
jgi:hypothetical protein